MLISTVAINSLDRIGNPVDWQDLALELGDDLSHDFSAA